MSFPSFLLRLHLLLILAFLLFYATKATLLFLGRADALRHLRARTRFADSGLGLLILGSGGGLLAQYPGAVPGWLWAELALVFVLLPLAVAAMRRQYKLGVALTLLGLLYGYGVAEAGSLTLRRPVRRPVSAAVPRPGRPETTATPDAAPPVETLPVHGPGLPELSETEVAALAAAGGAASASPESVGGGGLGEGKILFSKNCVVCHGANGKLGLNGAHDLTKSNLNTAGRTYLVTQGLGKMPSFKTKLTPAQIQQVVAYSLTLK